MHPASASRTATPPLAAADVDWSAPAESRPGVVVSASAPAAGAAAASAPTNSLSPGAPAASAAVAVAGAAAAAAWVPAPATASSAASAAVGHPLAYPQSSASGRPIPTSFASAAAAEAAAGGGPTWRGVGFAARSCQRRVWGDAVTSGSSAVSSAETSCRSSTVTAGCHAAAGCGDALPAARRAVGAAGEAARAKPCPAPPARLLGTGGGGGGVGHSGGRAEAATLPPGGSFQPADG
jgi:hypothetical protein